MISARLNACDYTEINVVKYR